MNKIVLEGDIVLKTVEAMATTLHGALQDKEVVEVVLRNTTKWDVAGIQMLYAFKKYHALQHRRVIFSGDDTGQLGYGQQLVELLNTQKIK